MTANLLWKLTDGRPGKYGAILPETVILVEDGSRVIGEARDPEDAASIVEAHNLAVSALTESVSSS
jgi:hypothetical protein